MAAGGPTFVFTASHPSETNSTDEHNEPGSQKRRSRLDVKIPDETVNGHAATSHHTSFSDKFEVEDEGNCIFEIEERFISTKLTESAHEKLCRPWKDALIVKLTGGDHTFSFIHSRLQQKWAPKNQWQLIDLANNFYIARFMNDQDRTFALTGGPWMIAGQYLAIQLWRPNFNASKETIRSMIVWIRIAGLPIEFIRDDFLRLVGNFLGATFKVYTSSEQGRRMFARLCVLIDVSKPLKTYVQIEDQYFKLQYEGLNMICFECGRYGHVKENCDFKQVDSENASSEEQIDEIHSEREVQKESGKVDKEPPSYGPWMQLLPSSRDRKKKEIQVCWIPPLRGHVKINCDGSRNRHGRLGAVGVIISETGEWIRGFMSKLGFGNVLKAEIIGINLGVKLAHKLGFQQIKVESNSLDAVEMFTKGCVENHSLANLIKETLEIKESMEFLSFSHVYREQNGVADLLAAKSLVSHLPYLEVEWPAEDVAEALLRDKVPCV